MLVLRWLLWATIRVTQLPVQAASVDSQLSAVGLKLMTAVAWPTIAVGWLNRPSKSTRVCYILSLWLF